MKGMQRVGAHDVQPVCGHSAYARCGHVVCGENFFFKEECSARVAPPPSPPKGFETYINSVFKTSMVWLGWGATSNSGQELTRGCYALKQKYHLPCLPPPLQISFPSIHTTK